MAEIGSTLRETRMRARIDISEVEARTKIRAKYLRAIENEEWDLLPGPVYVKSFLRTYGDYLGLDSRVLIDEFKRRYERPADHELRPMSSIARDRERAARAPKKPRVPPWMGIVAVLVFVGVVLGAIGILTGPSTTTPPPPTTARGVTHHHRKHRATKTTATTTPTTSTRTTTTPVRAATASVQITPTSAVWICVVTVKHGQQTPVFPAHDFTAGESVPIAHGSELLVTLGNAGADLKLDGRHYPLTASSQGIGLKVTPTQVTLLPAGTGPTCT